MAGKDKVQLYITIADEKIELNADLDHIEEIHRVEQRVDDLFRNWRKRFPAKTSRQLLAMMAYQYASFYHSLEGKMKAATVEAEEIEKLLQDALADAD